MTEKKLTIKRKHNSFSSSALSKLPLTSDKEKEKKKRKKNTNQLTKLAKQGRPSPEPPGPDRAKITERAQNKYPKEKEQTKAPPLFPGLPGKRQQPHRRKRSPKMSLIGGNAIDGQTTHRMTPLSLSPPAPLCERKKCAPATPSDWGVRNTNSPSILRNYPTRGI